MTAPVLRVEGVTAGYGGVPAIRDVSFSVEPGEVVALIGANGAGKTTTLLSIVGLLKPLSGRIEALGEEVDVRQPHSAARRGLLLVPDDRGLFPGLKVKEHFRLTPRRDDQRERLEPVLDQFPALRTRWDLSAELISGGEQQMLAIARAMYASPSVLLVDEMSLGLAPIIVEQILPVLRDFAKKNDVGLILVEQHVDLALSVADRGIVMDRGSIVMDKESQALLANRADLESAYFGSVHRE